jgi:hypothetical protein
MYQIINAQAVRRLSDGAFIPADPENSDWQAYQIWLGNGETPEPVEPEPVPVPPSVTMRQARLALLAAGLLSGVEAALDALPSPAREAARIEWEYSNEVMRHNGFVSQIGPLLNLTDAQLDALFLEASTR